MACKRCEILTFINDNGVDLFFVTETWLNAQGDEAITVELAPSGFDVKSFPCQSRSRGGGIATVYKSTLGSNITFEVVQPSTLHQIPPAILLTVFTEQLPDLLDYVSNLQDLFVMLVI